MYSQTTGLKPSRVRVLLDGASPIDPHDVAIVASQTGLAPDLLIGKPLRSVREILCASGRLAVPATGDAVDVPLGFVAGLAGVATFAEIVRHALTRSTDRRWEWDVRLELGINSWRLGPRQDCFVCGDSDFVSVYRSKYERAA